MNQSDLADLVITRKRKKYRFALFADSPLCFETDEWSIGAVDVMEIAAGNGLFSVELATRYPEKEFVAVDVKADRLQKGAREAAVRGLANIRFLRARVDQLPELVPAHSLSSLWITFPDPFPRAKKAKHRLTHPRYLSLYRELLSSRGEVCFKTDARNLFHYSLEQFTAQKWQLSELSFDLHDSTLCDDYKILTTYESRWINQGIPTNFTKVMKPNSVT